MGLGHELRLTLANAQAHRPRGGSHEGMAHLTDDPEERAKLPIRDVGTAGIPAPVCSPHHSHREQLNNLTPGLDPDSLLSRVAV